MISLDVARMRALGISPTPLLSLDRISPPGVRILAKAEWHLPTGSVKDRIAASMVARAESELLLHPGVRLLEASSGNTGIALARIARLAGYELTVLVPDNVSGERVALLAAFGARVRFTPGNEGSNGAVRRAEESSRDSDVVMLHQYENPANPGAHEQTTGPEILDSLATEGLDRLDAFVATLGTGGTLMGVGRALRRRFSSVQVVAAEPPTGELISGLRSLDDGYIPPVLELSELDGKVLVRTAASIAMTRKLISEEGLFVGPSSGAAVHAALRVASRLDPGSVVVTLLPDAGWKYLSTGIYSGSVEGAAQGVSDTTLW